MEAQLRRLGYTGEIVQVAGFNTFAEFSLSDETFTRKKQRVLRGSETLVQIRRQYLAHHLVVCPYSALGDVYWAMAFLPAYCRKNGIEKAAIITCGAACREVAGLCAVYTNITGGELPIRGTKPLRAPIPLIIAASEHAGRFVGIRSGLCDVLTTAKCQKTVIYPDSFYSTTPHKVADFFALPGWESQLFSSN